MAVLIRQAKVADPASDFHDQTVDILVADGIIHTIQAEIEAGDHEVISGEGLIVSPGWVDVFADYREPGYEHKETIQSGLEAAAAGGFTDVFLLPNTNPVADNKSIVQYIRQKAAGHAVQVHVLGALSQGTEGKVLAEMMDMRAHGAVAFSDGWKPVQSSNVLLKALEYVRAFDGIAVQVPVESSLSAGGLMHEGPLSTRMGMPGIPVLAETLLLHRDIELLRYTGSRLHVSGISSAEGVEMIRRAKEEGLQISCSVTPYHLALTDESLKTYDSLYKVNPPLRSETDRQALIAGLRDGTIDCIASHHRPQEWDAKAKEFDYASDGMNIQELAFPVMLQGIGNAVPLTRLVDALALAPRRIFGLPAAGIRKGAAAEMTIFTMDQATRINAGAQKSRSANNPFIGQELRGRVIGIINKNHIKQ